MKCKEKILQGNHVRCEKVSTTEDFLKLLGSMSIRIMKLRESIELKMEVTNRNVFTHQEMSEHLFVLFLNNSRINDMLLNFNHFKNLWVEKKIFTSHVWLEMSDSGIKFEVTSHKHHLAKTMKCNQN
ncbi:CLUMA_CG019682, isoform A [Clunio marinus]|uniref:CLUMA_CG019682, isoform A n=1 Tax=Clunio marinus TaxID=568069 RepID=A0A1J1J2L5_9DIPT|nr:CLUMA_CG019682, isoform A [Clunio marinus]